MGSRMFYSSRPDKWVEPRPHSDASLRYKKHGPIVPLEGDDPGMLERMVRAILKPIFTKSRRSSYE